MKTSAKVSYFDVLPKAKRLVNFLMAGAFTLTPFGGLPPLSVRRLSVLRI
jgi:hypothetical protein